MSRLFARRWPVIVLSALMLMLLAACGGPPPVSSWPNFVLNGNTAYVASSDNIYALDVSPNIADAKRLLSGWPIKPRTETTIGYYARPALSADGTQLYVGTETLNGNAGSVVALTNVQPDTKEAVGIGWAYPITTTDTNPGNLYGAVVRDENVLYFAGSRGTLDAIDAITGRPVWPRPFDPGTGTRVWSSPVVTNGLVLFASQDHHLYAVNAAEGTLAWKYPADGDAEIGTLPGSPTVHGDTAYVGSFDGYLYAIGLNGQLKWKFQSQGRLWDGPAEADGVLYFGDMSGNVYAISAGNGQPAKWAQNQKVEGGVVATPLLADGVVYVGTDQARIYAFDQDTGRPLWQAPYKARDGEMFNVTLALHEDTIVAVPSLAGADPIRLYGVDAKTGAQLWRYPPAPTQ